MRPHWDDYFLQIALDVAKRATCLRRCYGAVIVKDNRIFSTGYCGAPKGVKSCDEKGICKREEMKAKAGEHYEWCESVHAEANALIMCAPEYMKGATIYVIGFDTKTGELVDGKPCLMCMRMIRNANISQVIYRTKDSRRCYIRINQEDGELDKWEV